MLIILLGIAIMVLCLGVQGGAVDGDGGGLPVRVDAADGDRLGIEPGIDGEVDEVGAPDDPAGVTVQVFGAEDCGAGEVGDPGGLAEEL